MRKILVTGAAGFIGFHLSKRLINNTTDEVIGIDNLNDYYDVNLKIDRLKQIEERKNFRFIKMDIVDRNDIAMFFSKERFDIVVNLAAQAGVRYSLKNPYIYIDSNISGFLNILEGCRIIKLNILYLPHQALSMEQIQKCPFLFITMLTILYLSMVLLKRQMNLWYIHMQVYTTSRAQDSDFSQYMGSGVDLIWHYSCLQNL